MTDESENPQASAPVPSKPSAGGVKAFSCPSCGGTIEIRAAGLSITAICKSCGSIIDVADDNYRIVAKAAVKTRHTRLPMGARGILFGTLWEVIGYTGNSDGTGNYLWGEYLLFNPYQGFRFLVEDSGHWNFVKMLKKHIQGAGAAHELRLDGMKYRLFNRGDAIVQYVMGEFYWRVKIKDKSHVADYVAPPYILSMDESGTDVVWSQGIYVKREEIGKAFGLAVAETYYKAGDTGLIPPQGIGANQPPPGAVYYKQLIQLAFGFLAGLFVIQALLSSSFDSHQIYERHMDIVPANKGQVVITDPIEIAGGKGNIQIIGHSYVDNNWVEIYGSLVNDATQESDDFILPIEYYYGRDSDGNWTQGSHTARTLLSTVAAGHYHLVVETDAGAFTRLEPADFDIKLVRNVPMWENLWAAGLLLFAWPFCLVICRWYFETQRWQNSDFPPAIYKQT